MAETAIPEQADRTERKTDERAVAAEKPRRAPRYVVIVENDAEHTFPYVIDVLRRVCGHDRRRAYQLTNQVHFRGQAAVWVGALEHAELKRDLIRGFGPDIYAIKPVTFPLGVRIEPLNDDG